MAKYCLGIESTAHTLGIGIVDFEGRILANEFEFYKPRSAGWGIVPMESARNMEEKFDSALERALKSAGIAEKDICLAAFCRGPGMGPCLRVACRKGKELSEKWGVPAVDVNHIVAHVEMAKLAFKFKDPLILVVSGGTTQLVKSINQRYRVIGETLDIAIGNAFDKLARELEIGDGKLPWAGHLVSEKARGGRKYVPLKYLVKGMDLCFSGLVTSAAGKYRKGEKKEDLCYSFQETAMAMIAETAERALSYTGAEELLLTGGSARNERLQEMLRKVCNARGFGFGVTKGEYNQDNGAMIAWAGVLKYGALKNGAVNFEPDQHWRIDEEEAVWAEEKNGVEGKGNGFWGAEAFIEIRGGKAVKTRPRKDYRIREIDGLIVRQRTRGEAKKLGFACEIGLNVPRVSGCDEVKGVLEMDFIEGGTAKDFFDSGKSIAEKERLAGKIGRAVSIMHDNNLVHGDLSTKNMIVNQKGLFLIDFGLSEYSKKPEDKAIDVLLFLNIVKASYPGQGGAIVKSFLDAYRPAGRALVMGMLDKARNRGRHKKRQGRKNL